MMAAELIRQRKRERITGNLSNYDMDIDEDELRDNDEDTEDEADYVDDSSVDYEPVRW